ncbi:hypothetical protein E1A91_D10G249700v1 [Gossypium mustelinum]|uniref:Uncharacterized protein n=1 Tax=Gossypium mustelinum TaxID=34275 RepID=A0A5D2TBV3_GOSMU|nr:hypothetical protein E1A91_D10G249700v1 [Gossypium mustelinum]
MKKEIFLAFSAKKCFWAGLLLFLATQHINNAGSLFSSKMHFASISFHCWFFVPLPVFCSSSPLKKSLVLCSSSPPSVTSQVTNLVARCRRVYRHAHDYHINSISNNRQ